MQKAAHRSGCLKNACHDQSFRCKTFTKTLLRTKLTVLLITTFVHTCTAGMAQVISISGKDITLKTVFSEIKKQTGFVVFGKDDLLQKTKPVSLSAHAVPLSSFLEMVMKDQPLDYTIKSKTILLSPKPEIAIFSDQQTKDDEKTLVRITDMDGKPLSGASVASKKAKNLGVSNAQGVLDVNIAAGDVLVVTYVGYETKEITITASLLQQSGIVIALSPRLSQLDDIQVVAYGTNTQRFNVGNVSLVTAKDIAKSPVTDPLLAIQGRVPGMTINQTSGVQGSSVNVNIRGLNSLTAGAEPLFIVDGVPYRKDLVNIGFGAQKGASALNFINPANIESITVLKDADATAIYGSRGANGVVLITTKKAQAGGITVDVNLYRGFQAIPLNRIKMMNTEQYLKVRREAYYNDSLFNPAANIRPTLADAPDLLLWDTTRYFDFKKFWIGETAATTNANISISGGNEKVQFLIGGSYNRQTTIFPGNFYTQNGSVNAAVNATSANQKFRTSLSGSYAFNSQLMPALDLIAFAFYTPPNTPPYLKPDGSLNFAPNPETGLSTMGLMQSGLNQYGYVMGALNVPARTNNLISNLDLSYTLLPGLVLKATLGYNKQNTDVNNYTKSFPKDPARGPHNINASFSTSSSESWISEPQLNWNTRLGQGRFTFLVGATLQESRTSRLSLYLDGIPNDLMVTNPNAGKTYSGSGASSKYRYGALYSKINYVINDKYIVNITGRRDGSSRFGDDRKLAYFGAIGGGWIFSEEDFVKNAVGFLSYGKLRASYGITGNDQIGDYQYLDRYQVIPTYTGNSGYQGMTGMEQLGLFNPNYEWEKTTKLEFGIEAGFFNDRILANIGHYINRSGNQLQPIILPAMVGATAVPGNIPALIRNRGTEIVITSTNIKTEHFSWTSCFTLSFQENKLLSYTGTDNRFKQLTGKSLSTVMLSRYMGVDPQTGRYTFANAEGKAVFHDQDIDAAAVMLDLAPKYFGGFDNNITYKNFSFSIFFQYTKQFAKNTSSGGVGGYQPGKRVNQWATPYEDTWHKPGDIAKYARYSQDGSIDGDYSAFYGSDGFYADASYIRCKNVSLGWELPETWADKARLKRCRIYMQAQNLFTITGYPGSDPETQQVNNIPPMKIWTAGIQLSL